MRQHSLTAFNDRLTVWGLLTSDLGIHRLQCPCVFYQSHVARRHSHTTLNGPDTADKCFGHLRAPSTYAAASTGYETIFSHGFQQQNDGMGTLQLGLPFNAVCECRIVADGTRHHLGMDTIVLSLNAVSECRLVACTCSRVDENKHGASSLWH